MIYSEYVREKMKNLPKYAEAEGNPIVIDNSLKKPFKAINITAEGEAVESPILTVVGKNLFDIDNLQYIASTQWALNYYKPKVEDGIFYNGGSVYDEGVGAFVWIYCGKRPCTISFEVIGGGDGNYYTQFALFEFPSIPLNSIYTNRTDLIRQYRLYNKKYSFSVKPTQDYIGFAFAHNNTKYVIQVANIQIELGETATDYEPYKEEQVATLNGITLADGDSISHNGRTVIADIDGTKTDITDTEAGQGLLALHTNKGTTSVFLNSESGEGNLWIKYQRK